MPESMMTALTFFIGIISSKFAVKVNLPAGRLIGPIIAIGLLNIMGFAFNITGYFNIIFSIFLGLFIGLEIKKEIIKSLKSTLSPSIIIISWYVLITTVLGFFLWKGSVLDKITAYFSVIPGGIAEVNILAMSYDASLVQITTFQIARLMSIVIFVPMLINKIIRLERKNNNFVKQNKKKEIIKLEKDVVLQWIILLLAAAFGYFILNYFDLPAAGLIGALLASVSCNLFIKKEIKSPPVIFYHLSQIGMGSIIGTCFNGDSIQNILLLFYPVAIVTVIVMLNSLLLAFLFHKIFKWDFITSFLCVVPGGLAPMVIIAEEVKADLVIVSTIQMVRLTTAIIIIPLIYEFIIF